MSKAVNLTYIGDVRSLVADGKQIVFTTEHSESFIRSFNASGEKPPNTTECTAPIRAVANIATAASGIIGI